MIWVWSFLEQRFRRRLLDHWGVTTQSGTACHGVVAESGMLQLFRNAEFGLEKQDG